MIARVVGVRRERKGEDGGEVKVEEHAGSREKCKSLVTMGVTGTCNAWRLYR